MLLVAHRTPATRAACAGIAAAGARVFEADVQLDERDRIVASHYLPFAGLLQRDNWRVRHRWGGVRDPQITDVFAMVPADCLVLLDLKETRPVRRARLVATLIETFPDPVRLRVCGGHLDDLAVLRDAGWRTWRTLRNGREVSAVVAGGPLPDEAVSARHTALTRNATQRLHERVGTVVAWTVNDLGRARRLCDMGVDGVTTDRVEIIRALSAAAN